jgi:hypothetical protein
MIGVSRFKVLRAAYRSTPYYPPGDGRHQFDKCAQPGAGTLTQRHACLLGIASTRVRVGVAPAFRGLSGGCEIRGHERSRFLKATLPACLLWQATRLQYRSACMGFNRRKMEDQRRQAAEKEAAARRATDAGECNGDMSNLQIRRRGDRVGFY